MLRQFCLYGIIILCLSQDLKGERALAQKQYIAIDLKSFYASVECIDRGLDPMTTNLVVADASRTQKTICLAVSPSLKSFGIPGRPRLFEVVQRVKTVNLQRARAVGKRELESSSSDYKELRKNPSLAVDYIVAPPQMAHYMQMSARIYDIYLKYIAPEDIHVYSVDEVFIDATNYLRTYNMTSHELAMTMIRDVLKETGITATAGIGTNMYLCKIAMDIVAKHIPADKDGVRIAELDEKSYREKLWAHTPITDFWRVGKGISKRLERLGVFTMGDIARLSVENEDVLYKEFGVNAELLIDHAWGWEPCTIKHIKEYEPEGQSITSGQVLSVGYPFKKAKLIAREMAELLALDLVDKKVVTDQIVLTVGYDIDNPDYRGEMETDRYGRRVPKQAHSSENIGRFTASSKLIVDSTMALFERIVNKDLLVRRMYIVANHIVGENSPKATEQVEQLDLFTDFEKKQKEDEFLEKEKNIQKAVLGLQKKFGKNAVIKGMNLEEGATSVERNKMIGGHKA